MPLYEVILEQNFANQQCINKWNYLSGEIPAGVSGAFKAIVGMGFAPDDDIEPFGAETIAGKMQVLQASFCFFVQVIARDIFNPLDYFTYAFPADTHGNNGTTQPMSPAAAYSFATNRSRGDMSRGQKRFVGVVEGAVGDLGIIISDALDELQILGDTMADINVVPAGEDTITFTPYVFGTTPYTTPSGKTAYHYYPTEEDQLENIMRITQWTPKPQMRTQVSRQYGHGR